MKKGFATILILAIALAIIAVGSVAYFYLRPKSPSPNQSIPSPNPSLILNGSAATIDCKMYKNLQYKFELSCPSGWYSAEVHQKKAFTLIFDRKPIIEEEAKTILLTHLWPGLSIAVSKELYGKDTLQKTGIEKIEVPGGESLINDRYELTTFAGIPANKGILFSFEEPPYSTRIIFNYSGYGWRILYPNTDDKGAHDPIYDQILSTFKFLD